MDYSGQLGQFVYPFIYRNLSNKKNRLLASHIKKKADTGVTLIEITIVIVIFGIIFGAGGIYFVSSLREYRISAQYDYLYREARYALDYIINGRMVKENNHKLVRYAGIIGSRRVEIREGGQVANEGEEIRLKGREDVHIGTIKLDSNAETLFFIDANNNYYRIIPQGSDDFDESDLENPYTIDILFTRNNQDPSLISIVLRLRKRVDLHFQQDPNVGRWLDVEMRSTVGLQNYYKTELYRRITQLNEE